MSAEQAIDEIEAVINGPIGHGDLQAAVWYSKLQEIRNVIDEYRENTP